MTNLENNKIEETKRIEENNKIEETKKNDKTGTPCSPCFYTSILFLIVATKALYNNYIPYGLLWLQLSITSIIYHGKMYSESNKDYLLTYDKASAYLVVLYGAYLLLHKITCFSAKNNNKYKKFNICDFLTIIVIIISFLTIIYLYHYGYQISKYCFDDNKETAHFYHMVLHLLSIIGHLLIILL
jgi:hypothetical protein